LHGHPYTNKLCEFGERVLALVPQHKSVKNVLANRWFSAIWLGKSDLSDEHLVWLPEEGVVPVRTVRRVSVDRWCPMMLSSIVSTPRKPNAKLEGEKDAPTPGCPRCEKRRKGSHTAECRRRREAMYTTNRPELKSEPVQEKSTTDGRSSGSGQSQEERERSLQQQREQEQQ